MNHIGSHVMFESPKGVFVVVLMIYPDYVFVLFLGTNRALCAFENVLMVFE